VPTLFGAGGGSEGGVGIGNPKDKARLPTGRRDLAILVTSLFCIGRDRKAPAFAGASLNGGDREVRMAQARHPLVRRVYGCCTMCDCALSHRPVAIARGVRAAVDAFRSAVRSVY
jgi:hypothetical protein